MAAVWVLRLVFIAMVVTGSLGFVLRRRNWNDDADSGLAEALPVLREERRRLEERPPPEGVASYWAEPEEDEPELDLEGRLGDTTEFLDTLLGNNEENSRYYIPGVGFEDREDNEDDIVTDTVDDVKDITESPADMNELKTILEPSEDEKNKEEEKEEEEAQEQKPVRQAEEKKNIPIALGGPGPDWSKRSQKGFGRMDLEQLIEKTAEKLALDEEEAEAEDGDVTPLPVSDSELEEVLSDEDEEEENDGNEEVLPPLVLESRPRLKIKRSSRSDLQQIENAVSDDAMDSGSIAREYIRHFLELEDDENTNLANALNLATMAQVRRDDQLVVPEARYIKKAIEDEEAIRELRAELGRGSQEPSPVVAAAEAIAKREMQVQVDRDLEEEEPEEELTKEDVEYVPEDAEGEDGDGKMIQEVGFRYEEEPTDLARKLRQYLAHAGALQRENEITEEDYGEDEQLPHGGSWLDQPLELSQEGIAQDDWELNPLIRELYQRYSVGQLSKRGQPEVQSLEQRLKLGPAIEEFVDPLEEEEMELEGEGPEDEEEESPSPQEIEDIEAEIEDALEEYMLARKLEQAQARKDEEDMCPAVQLVDGCQYAVKELGLKLDAEAVDLCNRHQLCYTCGAAHGMTSLECDNGYLQEANQLCEADGDNEDCSTDAAGLFILMLQSHQYYSNVANVPSGCENRCTMDYIIGLDK